MSYREFPDYFADAEASWGDADYVFYGIPYDRTGSFRAGTADGPKHIRRAAWNLELFHIPTGLHMEDFKAHDYGDLDITNEDKPDTMVDKGYAFGKRLMADRKIPMLMGGEHNVQMGAFRAIAETYPDLCVLQIDAHLDYRDEYDGSKYNHANAARRFVDGVGADRFAIIGVRSMEREERADAERDGVLQHCYTSFMVKERGMRAVLDEVFQRFGDRPVYLSIDIDGIDPAYAPGTGTPEPFGLTDWDVLDAVKRAAPNMIGMDVCEVAPEFDSGQTAMLAAKFFREAMFWQRAAQEKGHRVPVVAAKAH